MSIFAYGKLPATIAVAAALGLSCSALPASAQTRAGVRHVGAIHAAGGPFVVAREGVYGAPYPAYSSSDWPYYDADEPYFSGPESYRRAYYRPYGAGPYYSAY